MKCVIKEGLVNLLKSLIKREALSVRSLGNHLHPLNSGTFLSFDVSSTHIFIIDIFKYCT